ncbi:STAS/SEC14 domain-containing protein [Erythrobacter crassostreae]|uniref:STAS/SEC14 domain-containing protein n=1 Tax=Erythrobacter crassostreae TaxID=2828328 RepID=A0A9X1JK67_9SPHN|nr:STAS/SEC14 domain-containing protein [Erythrobacter crassostrea]MBV7258641.1 STAS/SEC14 domain-containing protein [Erythrobacter crassostrea]
MINIEKLTDNAHRIVVMGEFRQSDAERLVEFASDCNVSRGGGHILIDLTAVTDFSFSAVAVEMAHMPALFKWIYGLDRIAIVSDNDWVRTGARLESALLPGLVYEVYDEDEADAALSWITEKADAPHKGAIRELDIGKPDIAAYEISGRLDREESERATAMIRARFDQTGCSRLMLVIRNWHGFDADTMFSAQVFSSKLELMRQLDRYAIVGGPSWIKNIAGFMDALIKPKLRCYDLDDQDKAIAWLEAGD